MDIRPEQFEEIRNLAAYRAEIGKLRRNAIGAIFFGGLAVFGGYRGLQVHPINAVLLGIGVLLVFMGLWQLSAPSLRGLLAEAFAFFAAAAWNVAIAILNSLSSGSDVEFPVLVIGAIQAFWGVACLTRYQRLRRAFPREPSVETVGAVDEIVRTVRGLKPKRSENGIEFLVTPLIGFPDHLSGLLLEGAAFFVSKQHTVLCGARHEVSIERKRKLVMQKNYKAVLRMGAAKYTGVIPAASLERFEAWQAAAPDVPVAPPVAAVEAVGVPDEDERASLGSLPPVQR